MPDTSDVEAALVTLAAGILYPPGTPTTGASVAGVETRVFRGWPTNKTLDPDLKAGRAHVSVFQEPGFFRLGDGALNRIISHPGAAPGLVLAVTGSTVQITGQATAGQVVGVKIGATTYTYIVQANATLATIAVALAGMIADPGLVDQGGTALTTEGGVPLMMTPSAVVTAYPNTAGTSGVTMTTLGGDPTGNTAPNPALMARIDIGTTLPVDARVGTPGLEVTRLRDQEARFSLSIWAPDPAKRDVLGKLLSAAIAGAPFLALPDQETGRVMGRGSRSVDTTQKENLWRRDLLVTVEWWETTSRAVPPALWPNTAVTFTR